MLNYKLLLELINTVSVEEVINSRCSSCSNHDEMRSHWGKFLNNSPSKESINYILQCCDGVPRFGTGKLLHWFNEDLLYLGFERQITPSLERLMHIESGMQQEAVYLACATLGLGTCILNQGINGTAYDQKLATASHIIREIDEPYESGKFTSESPGPKKAFKSGKNLSIPVRNGELECLPELKHLTSSVKSGIVSKEKDLSQLLWSAKGRTPHLLRMHRWNNLWGLTIPTWKGDKNHTTVYLVKDGCLFQYLNWTENFSFLNRGLLYFPKWTRGNPTHDMFFVKNLNITSHLDGFSTAIILCRTEETNRSLWEVGYMLENMYLQAKSLGISYSSKIFKDYETNQLANAGVNEAVAALLLT